MVGEGPKLSKDELREDEFVEWIMRAVDYVQERIKFFAAGAAGLVVLLLVINYIVESQERARMEAATLLGEALIAEESGQFGETIRIAEQLITSYAGTPAAAQGMLVLANRYFVQGNFDDAQRLYERFLSDYGQTDVLVYAAWSGIASCLEARGQVQEAARKYQDYAAAHPGTVQTAFALWEAARCHGWVGDLATRKSLLEQIIRDFADLPVAARAQAAIAML